MQAAFSPKVYKSDLITVDTVMSVGWSLLTTILLMGTQLIDTLGFFQNFFTQNHGCLNMHKTIVVGRHLSSVVVVVDTHFAQISSVGRMLPVGSN